MGNQIYDGSNEDCWLSLNGVSSSASGAAYPDNNTDGGWACWKIGGTCTGIAYRVAGMQSLVSAVRTAGANNLILVAGIEYANDLSQWLQNEPSDSANNLALSWHVYPNSNYIGAGAQPARNLRLSSIRP
jgi:hypothetical protein